jgi:hypothetical protein
MPNALGDYLSFNVPSGVLRAHGEKGLSTQSRS